MAKSLATLPTLVIHNKKCDSFIVVHVLYSGRDYCVSFKD